MADICRNTAIDKNRSKEFSEKYETNTIEPKDGSPSPTLEKLVVLWEV
jgi:hypothetical protein